jgi:hypothetical protein
MKVAILQIHLSMHVPKWFVLLCICENWNNLIMKINVFKYTFMVGHLWDSSVANS